MKTIAILISIIVTQVVMGQDSLITAYWENGNPKKIEFYQNTILVKTQLFYTNKFLWEERYNFTDSGCTLKRYDTYGHLELTILLDASGMMHGTYTSHYSNGDLYKEGEYRHGKKEGTWICWYEGRKIQSSYLYKNDYAISGKEWWENGNLMKETDSLGTIIHYHENGSKESVLMPDGQRKNYTRWNEAGSKIEEGKFKDNDYFLINYWNDQNIQTVKNGNGYVESTDGELGIKITWKYKNGQKILVE